MEVEPPSPEVEILARQESNEDLKTRDKCVEIIKNWLLQQPHLPDTWDDAIIMNFLRGSKFSLEKCKEKIDKYFTVKTTLPEFFSNRSFKIESVTKASEFLDCFPLCGVTDKGCSITVVRLRSKTEFYFPDAVKYGFMVLDLRMKQEQFSNSGHIGILDAENLTSFHLTSVTPTLLKKLVASLFDAYSLRIKEIHVINIHPLINTVFNLLKPLLKRKIVDRFHFHNMTESSGKRSYDTLYNFVPQRLLPKDYGGDCGSLRDRSDLWIQNLKDNEAFFDEQDSLRVDETKRVGKIVNHEVLFGMEGSFKQLNVD